MTGSGKKEVEFETTLEELEDIVARLDREGVGLDDAIALFEKGIDRLKRANLWLDRASGRVEELIATAAGNVETRPLSDDAVAAEEADDDEFGEDS